MDNEMKSKKKKLIGVVLLIVFILFYSYTVLTGFIGTCAGAICVVTGSVVFLILAIFLGEKPKGLIRYWVFLMLILATFFFIRILSDGCS